MGNTTSSSTGGTSNSSSVNGGQSTSITVEGSKDFTLQMPNYVQNGQQSIDTSGGSNPTANFSVQTYVTSTPSGDSSNGIMAGFTIPLGTDRAKKAQAIAIDRAKTASLAEKIRLVIELKNAGLKIQDTPETHELYKIYNSITK